MKTFDVYKRVYDSLKNNIFKYILIYSISQLVAYSFLKLVTVTLLNLALKNAGLSGITNENFFSVLSSPFTIILLLITLVSLGILAIVQNLIIFNLTIDKGNIKGVLKPLNRLRLSDVIPLIFYTILVFPFSNIGLTVYFVSSLKIPSFVLEVFFQNYILLIIYYLVLIVILILNLKYYYTFIIFYKEDVSFKEALKLSYQKSKNKAYEIILFNILVAVFAIVASLAVSGLYIIFNYLAKNITVAESIIVSVGASVIIIVALLSYVTTSIYYIQFMIVSYRSDLVSINENRSKDYFKLFIPIAAISIAIYSFIIYTPTAEIEHVSIISHRGVMDNAVENTVESLKEANDILVDYVELDVQELADGEIIVFHDPSFKRLGNLNKKVEDATWSEISDLRLKDKKKTGLIPRFDEYLDLAKELNQKLLIEIKVNPKDSDSFIKNVIELVDQKGMSEMVRYQSLNKEAILKAKVIDPSIYTAYIIGFNLGGLEKLDIDAYAIDVTSLTKRVVFETMLMDKDLFIWSVDTSDIIERSFAKKPDAIITDHIKEVREVRKDLVEEPLARMLWQIEF